jgi:hypothetical protein
MPKSKHNVSEKTKQRKMDVRDRQIKKLNALHPLRCAVAPPAATAFSVHSSPP